MTDGEGNTSGGPADIKGSQGKTSRELLNAHTLLVERLACQLEDKHSKEKDEEALEQNPGPAQTARFSSEKSHDFEVRALEQGLGTIKAMA
ncbi:hypothetical protein WJX84_005816 [Apatococcus fuscideae]|uniref:Uncharacterized protein n=1 Tax=Apatococcus fuscideae TaxID=2026836 RepID=A0AAW1SNI1_9CHLO